MSQNVKLLTAGGFLSFFVFGFIDNLKGPLLPEVLRDEALGQGGLSYRQGGTFFLAAYVGFVVATLLTGVIADLVSNRRVLLLAGLSLGVGIVGLNVSAIYGVLLAAMLVIGLGLGAIEVGGNGLMVELHSTSRARYLNLLATFHSVGSLLVPLVAAWLLACALPWQQIYLCSAVLAGLLVVLFAISPRVELVRTNNTERRPWNQVLRTAFTLHMGWFYLLIATYVAVELGVAAWMVEYLQQVRGMGRASSSFMLSGFFGLIMLGRFVGSFIVDSVGFYRIIKWSLISTLLCLAVGIFGPSELVWLLPMSGLCMSIVFPTVAAAVADLHTDNIGTIFGVLFTFGGVGGAIGPWVIGLVSDTYGLQIGLACTLVYSLLALLSLVVVASPRTRHRKTIF